MDISVISVTFCNCGCNKHGKFEKKWGCGWFLIFCSSTLSKIQHQTFKCISIKFTKGALYLTVGIGLSHSSAIFSSLFVKFFCFFFNLVVFGDCLLLRWFCMFVWCRHKTTRNVLFDPSVSKTTEGEAIFDRGKFINLSDILGVSLLGGRWYVWLSKAVGLNVLGIADHNVLKGPRNSHKTPHLIQVLEIVKTQHQQHAISHFSALAWFWVAFVFEGLEEGAW